MEFVVMTSMPGFRTNLTDKKPKILVLWIGYAFVSKFWISVIFWRDHIV